MAQILGQITVENVLIINTDTNPAIGGGTVANIGCMAIASDGSGIFTKVGALNTDWIISTAIINTQNIISSATVTPIGDVNDAINITAQAIALFVANPSGNTPQNFKVLKFRIKDNGTARAITWDTQYIAMGVDLPQSTVAGKIMTIAFIYDTNLLKWGCVAVAIQT
jgi:hypothetical protein